MPWKPEVQVDGQWSRNSLVFATEEEAKANARALMMRWFAVTDSRAVEVDATHKVNYRYVDHELIEVK
jgi:hypothetical protein